MNWLSRILKTNERKDLTRNVRDTGGGDLHQDVRDVVLPFTKKKYKIKGRPNVNNKKERHQFGKRPSERDSRPLC